MQATLREEESAVSALEEQVAQQRNRVTVDRRELASREAQLEETRKDLGKALAEDARRRFEQIVRERDAAAALFVEAAELLIDRLDEVERSTDAARLAWANVQKADASAGQLDTPLPTEVQAEPEGMREAWERLRARIRQRIDDQFEDELVEAASRSPLGTAIQDLPAHLREVARRRRQARMRADGRAS